MKSTPLSESLGLRYPLFQAPTGSVAGPELAAAVSRAGGLGSMGITWHTETDAVAQIRQIQAQTSAPFFVNYALAFSPHSLVAVLETGVPIITFSWGDPAPYLPLLRYFGTKVGVQVTNREGAIRMCDLGVDFLVCQGVEAGGHVQANRSLWETLPEILEAAGKTPVVASGGMGDGKAIVRALRMGAQAVQLGTHFVATLESRAHSIYKEALCRAGAQDAALTVCFEGGWSYAAHRVLRNSTLETWEGSGSPPVGSRPGEGEVIAHSATGATILRYEDTAPKQGMTGNIEAMCLYAGQSCETVQAIVSAEECLQRLVAECEQEAFI